MENIGIMLYLWSISTQIVATLGVVIFVGCAYTVIIGIISGVSVAECYYEKDKADKRAYWKEFYKNYVPFKTLAALLIIHALIPSKQDMAIIFAGSVAGQTITSSLQDENSKLNKVSKIIDQELDDVLADLLKKKESKK